MSLRLPRRASRWILYSRAHPPPTVPRFVCCSHPNHTRIGDCCECDCVSATYRCGISGYNCLDPASTCTSRSYIDDDAEDYTDRRIGDSSTAAIPADQQEAWAGESSETSFTKFEIVGIFASASFGFGMLGWGLLTVCIFARDRCFDGRKDGATRGKTAGTNAVSSKGRRTQSLGGPLPVSVATALTIPPETTEDIPTAGKTALQRFGAADHSSWWDVYPGVEQRNGDEKVEDGPSLYSNARSGGGRAVKRDDPGDSEARGGLGHTARAASDGVPAGAATADVGNAEGGEDVLQGSDASAGNAAADAADGEVVAPASDGGGRDGVVGATDDEQKSGTSVVDISSSNAQPAEGMEAFGGDVDADEPSSGDVAADADSFDAASGVAPGDDAVPARADVSAGAVAADAVDEEVSAAIDDGATGGLVGAAGNEEDNAGSVEEISSGRVQPMEGATADGVS